MTKFINSDNDTYTNINLIETIIFKTDKEGDYVSFSVKDQPAKKVYNGSETYTLLKSLCVE